MNNALAYARVSTREQAEKGLSIPAQLNAIREYASSHGSRILEEYCKGSFLQTREERLFKIALN